MGTKITISDYNGKILEETTLTDLPVGENYFERDFKQNLAGGNYIVTIETSYEKATRKVVLKRSH